MRQRRSRQLIVDVGVGVVVAVDLTIKLAAATLAAGARSGPITPVDNPEFSLGTASGPFIVMIFLAAVGITCAAHFTVRPALRGDLPVWIPIAVEWRTGQPRRPSHHRGRARLRLHPWVVLNLADLCVVAGLLGLALHHHQPKEVTS